MKKLLVLVMMFLLVTAGTAYAKGDPCENKYLSKIVNDCSPHTVDTDTDTHVEERDKAGVGADVVIWQNETDKVTWIEEVVAEYRYDIDNEAHSVFGVVRVNLWSKIKGLFNRD